MLAIDGHLHLAQDALRWNRDITKSVVAIRQAEAGMAQKGRARGTVALPEMRRGKVALAFALICVSTDPDAKTEGGFRAPEATFAYAQGELAYYRLLEGAGLLRQVRDTEALTAHMAEWKGAADSTPPIGFVLAMEGCDPILSPGQLAWWWEEGLRLASLSHYGQGRYAAGTGPSGGVTATGRELLKEMERLGVALDVAHLSEEAFWQATELYRGPIAFSHGGTRALNPIWRSLSDDQLKVLIERDGVIGISMDCWQISRGWVRGESTPDQVSLSKAIEHIEHICQMAGDADHAAIGSDLDGGFGTEQTPQEVDSIADLQKLTPLLAARGYSEQDIAKVMHGNWVRLLKKAWGS